MALSVEEHVFLVEHYIKNAFLRDYQIAFKSRFGGRTKPLKPVIWKLEKQLREIGGMKVKKPMRQPSVVPPEKVDEVRETMEVNLKKSLRCLAQQAHCSYSSARKGVKTLKLYPHKIHAARQLLEPGKETCHLL